MNPVTHNDVDEFWKYNKLAGGFASKIDERLDFIIRRVFTEFGSTINYWYFDDAPEGDQGQLSRHLPSKPISEWDGEVITGYIVEAASDEDAGYAGERCLILNDGSVHEFYGIPARWLFEDFEEELVNGKRLWEEREATQKQERAARKAAKKAAKEAAKVSAVAKLTPAERAALGI